jgi:hypothetical protein
MMMRDELARADAEGRLRRRNGTFVVYESRLAKLEDWRYPGQFFKAWRYRLFGERR